MEIGEGKAICSNCHRETVTPPEGSGIDNSVRCENCEYVRIVCAKEERLEKAGCFKPMDWEVRNGLTVHIVKLLRTERRKS